MRMLFDWRGGLTVVALFSILGANLTPALAAASEPTVAAQASAASISGSVKDNAGAAVVGARVLLSGPANQETTTDAQGAFTVNLPAGIYRVSIQKPGYNPVSLNDVTVTSGTATPLAVTMAQQDLSSLRTIGTVTATRANSTINAGPATSTFLPATQIQNFGAPQISDVIQHIPGVTVQQMGSQQDRSIVVGGVQPYETQVLLDGHPLALGQNGVWVSTYFPSALLGGIETQVGPGNTTPFANIAVGGTANLLTPSFTKKPHLTLTQSFDNYASSGSTLLATGSIGQLGYVVDLTTNGLNSPFTGGTRCLVTLDTGAAAGKNTGTINTCTQSDGNLYQKGEVFKLKYDFTPTTSLEAAYIGAFGGWNPQGTAWGNVQGPITIKQCSTNGYQCTNPNFSQYIGSTINGFFWYTGSAIYNNQHVWDAQLRTALGNTTILIRPYLGVIEPEITTGGLQQASYPNFFGPPGAVGSPNGPSFPNGTTPPASFTATTPAEKACAGAFGNLTNPAGQYVVVNNQFECFGSAFITYEQDKLYGNTASIIQPFGNDNLLNLTYDFHGQSTTAVIAFPGNYAVPPGTADRYSTFSLTGSFHLTPQLSTDIGLYTTQWQVFGSTSTSSNATIINNVVTGLNSGTLPGQPASTGLNRSVTHGDPHLAFVFRPDQDTAIRVAAGSSTTFPFVDQVSGGIQYETPACTLGPPFADGGTLILKNPALQPETSIGYALGADIRTHHAGTFSIDLADTIVHNVFETTTQSYALGASVPDSCGIGTPALLGVFQPVNIAKLDAKSIIVKYNYAPVKGFGFNLSATAESSILSGLGPNLFTPTLPGAAPVYGVPANNVQICGNGTTAPGIATCIPYLQGYGQFTWAQPDGSFVGLGVNYQGKNNAYFQPPFALVDFTAIRPVSKYGQIQLSVQNLLNTNNYGAYLPISPGTAFPYPGAPIVGNTSNATQTAISQGSFYPTVVPATARYVRLIMQVHI
jgi:hypothetical protein